MSNALLLAKVERDSIGTDESFSLSLSLYMLAEHAMNQ